MAFPKLQKKKRRGANNDKTQRHCYNKRHIHIEALQEKISWIGQQ